MSNKASALVAVESFSERLPRGEAGEAVKDYLHVAPSRLLSRIVRGNSFSYRSTGCTSLFVTFIVQYVGAPR